MIISLVSEDTQNFGFSQLIYPGTLRVHDLLRYLYLIPILYRYNLFSFA